MESSAPFILLVIVGCIPTSSTLRAQGCIRYSFGMPIGSTGSANGVIAPASGSETDTYSAAGYQYCAQNSTTTQNITSAFFCGFRGMAISVPN
jgi:hypothetical protein